ncbi:helix-turn-helix transcriptional regulator [Kribbella sp. CWNU-51]
MDHPTDDVRDQILAAMVPVVHGIQATFGPDCEAVLHDYRTPESSVVAVAGGVTGREPASAMSEIGLRMLRRGDAAEDDLNYFARLPDGRQIKSSTILLRDPGGHVFGALCINVDVTALRSAGQAISRMLGQQTAEDALPTFSSDPDAIIDSALNEAEQTLGRPLRGLSAADRLELFRLLDARGVFQLRKATTAVAQRLGVSRASAYKYLSQAREDEQA